MKRVVIKFIDIYQNLFSFGGSFSSRQVPRCVFYPSCSDYAKEAINRYGFKGVILSFRRLLRCHPWQKEHFDPIP